MIMYINSKWVYKQYFFFTDIPSFSLGTIFFFSGFQVFAGKMEGISIQNIGSSIDAESYGIPAELNQFGKNSENLHQQIA